MFTVPFITDAHPSYTVGDVILPWDAHQWKPVNRYTRIKYPFPYMWCFAVLRPFDFVKLGHFLIDDIDQIYGLAWPPANFGSKKNPTCPSYPSATFPHLLTIFGSRAQGVNINRGYFSTFYDGSIDNEMKSECFLHPHFTFYPHPMSGKYLFQTPRWLRWGGWNK